MEIYIIRHAETARNRAKVLQGRSNFPLNEAGEEQSRKTGEFFKEKGIRFDRVYASPLIRCVQTAGIIAEETESVLSAETAGTRVITDERLLEMDYGPYEGMSLENPPPEIIHFFSDFVHNKEPEGMESLQSVKERMSGFLAALKEEPYDCVMIATHAIAMKGALEVLTPKSQGSYWPKYIGNCSVYHTSLKDGSFSIPEEIFTMSHEAGV